LYNPFRLVLRAYCVAHITIVEPHTVGVSYVATANTMGIDVVACLTIGTALPTVRMTSTLRRTNSAAISA